jgi:protein ImuB
MSAGSPPRVLVVWCPDWPVTAAGVALGEPAVVVHANRVVAVSPAARHDGVVPGLRRREAQSRCPGLAVVAHDPTRDARAFEPVLQAVAALTPQVELTEPGVCTFGTRGPSRYYGGDEALARRAAGLAAAALGPNLAVAGPPGVGVADGRFAAALAARHAAGADPLIVAPGGSAGFLAPLPVTALDDPELVDLLPRLGLRTLGALAALPAADVVARFGPAGRLAHRRASGQDDRPVDARPPPPDLAVQMELDPPVTDVGPVAFAGKHLADELSARLGARGLACTRLLVVAETEHGERQERLWRHEHAFTAAALTERVRWQLEGWAGAGNQAPTGGITLLRLVPDEVVPDGGRQLGFWGGLTQADERAARAAARLMGLLGPEAVTVPEWRGGRDPGAVVASVPAAAVDLAERVTAVVAPKGAGPWPGRLPAPAPASVLSEQVAAEVLDGDGRVVRVTGRGQPSAPPARLAVGGGRARRVVAWAGPWPADERWWDPATHRRRARFQLLTDDGAAHLAVVEAGRWWLEAVYD